MMQAVISYLLLFLLSSNHAVLSLKGMYHFGSGLYEKVSTAF